MFFLHSWTFVKYELFEKNKLHIFKLHLYKAELTNNLTRNSLCLSFKTKKLCISVEKKNMPTNPNFEQIYKIWTSFYSKSSTRRYIFFITYFLIAQWNFQTKSELVYENRIKVSIALWYQGTIHCPICHIFLYKVSHVKQQNLIQEKENYNCFYYIYLK